MLAELAQRVAKASALGTLFAAVLSARPLLAQADSTPGLRMLSTLPAPTVYRVYRPGWSMMTGRFVRAAADSLIFLSQARDLSIPSSQISAIWFRQGTNSGRGFLLGAGLGIAAGLVIAAGAGTEDLSRGTALAIFAGGLGAAGGIAGAIIGMNSARWGPIPWP